MGAGIIQWFGEKTADWLTEERPLRGMPLCNYDRLLCAIRPCDVILVEGRARVSEVIKTITQSPWSHSALYIGRLSQIEDPAQRERIKQFFDGDPEEPLIVEALLGHGTVVNPLSIYRTHHMRLCRPRGISQWDALKVIGFAIDRLGSEYNVRQLFDMARFFIPFGVIPRRFRNSLFENRAGDNTRTVCSSMMAQAFMSVNYPILPVVQRDVDGTLRLYRRNFRLFTPKDFDHSPYFEVIKYPLVGHEDLANYRNLPWDTSGVMCDAYGECSSPVPGPVVAVPWHVRLLKSGRRLLRLLGKPRFPVLANHFLWHTTEDSSGRAVSSASTRVRMPPHEGDGSGKEGGVS